MEKARQYNKIDRINLVCCAVGTVTGGLFFSLSGPASHLKYEYILDTNSPILSQMILFTCILYLCTNGIFARSFWPIAIGFVAIFPAVGFSGMLYCSKLFPVYRGGQDLYSLLFVPFFVTPCLSWAWLFGAEAGAGYVCARYVAGRWRSKNAV